ncbi:MAG: Hint domain-containing protein [Pseudomonadota bacterium]
MSWVGLADAQGAEFDLTGLHGRPRKRAPIAQTSREDALATRGTILLEADVAQFTVPRPLIGYGLGASFMLKVDFGTEDKLDFMLSIGDGCWQHRLPLRITNDLQVVRISYAWDAASRAGVLSVFQPRSRHLAQCLVPAPRPLPWAVLRTLMHEAPEMCRENDVGFVALSRGFEPAGPMPGIHGSIELATPQGMRPIRDIGMGARVLSPEGRTLRVMRAVKRLLPARGSFAPHTLRAPYLGLERDLTLSGETLVKLEGSDVEYLLGVEAVLAQVNQIGEHRAPRIHPRASTATYHQLILDEVDTVDATIGVSSLDLSPVPREGLAAATTLWADVSPRAPVRPASEPLPVARGYEIVSLNATRAA